MHDAQEGTPLASGVRWLFGNPKGMVSGKYVFGTPLFPEVTMQVGNGKTFTIRARNVSDENIYIQSASLNGMPYTRSYIMYQDIVSGGTLEFQMGPQPSDFGTKTGSPGKTRSLANWY